MIEKSTLDAKVSHMPSGKKNNWFTGSEKAAEPHKFIFAFILHKNCFYLRMLMVFPGKFMALQQVSFDGIR